jgi:hypothetical protein
VRVKKNYKKVKEQSDLDEFVEIHLRLNNRQDVVELASGPQPGMSTTPMHANPCSTLSGFLLSPLDFLRGFGYVRQALGCIGTAIELLILITCSG